MSEDEVNLTKEQWELLYLISKLTDSLNCPISWVKETPLRALIFHAIRKGIFNEYDYAPISTSFLGKGRKFINISKEGEDDLGDLRELGLLETIRLSSAQHDYITAYRPTKESAKFLTNIDKEVQNTIDSMFICPKCNKNSSLNIDADNSQFTMVCSECGYQEFIPFSIPEDVSYATKAYFFKFLQRKQSKKEEEKW
jgi:transcription elongation factor Elf1